MRVIIAGSRDYQGSIEGVAAAVKASGFKISRVLSGCQQGADRAGELWALTQSIPVSHYPPCFATKGRKGGPIRNTEMAQNAEALIVIKTSPDSRGSNDMIRKAVKAGLKIFLEELY